MVSSRRSIFFSDSVISTMSGHAEVTKIRSGMVETGFSQAREPGRSAMRDTSGGRCVWIPFWIAARAQSCLQVYRPWFKLTGQFDRMWWTVGLVLQQRVHLASALYFHLFRFKGVGSVSVPARSVKEH